MRLDRLRRFEEGGQPQGPDPMQILQAYAQANQMDEETFAQFMQEFQSMAPQEQQHVLQVISQQLEQAAQQQAPQGQMPLREGDEMPQQDPSQNPMVAQLGGMIDNSTYDPYTRSYTLPKAGYGMYDDGDPLLNYPVPTEKKNKIIKQTVQSTPITQRDSTSISGLTPEQAALKGLIPKSDTIPEKPKGSELLKPKDSFNLAEILNNDAAKYKKIDDDNKKGYLYRESNDTNRDERSKAYISGGSSIGGLNMTIPTVKYNKVPIPKQELPYQKSNELREIYSYSNGDQIVLHPKSSLFVKRNNKTGKYSPVTLLDMQTASDGALPEIKKLIDKYYVR